MSNETVAMCGECGEVTSCDEDRCCLMCGCDLIVCADRGSADVLQEVFDEHHRLEASLRNREELLASVLEVINGPRPATTDDICWRILRVLQPALPTDPETKA